MVTYYGDFAEDDTVLIPFNTFSSDDPSASVTITNLADADIMVHKDAGLTQIATDGATVVIDFDSITGNHMVTIDTSAHADYATGSEYAVRIEGTTVDGGTINAWIGSFSIERAGGVLALLKATTLASIKAETALIVADTNELQTDDVPGLIATAQSDLDTLTGSDGATLATAQGNYSPAKAGDSMDILSISGDTTAADNLELQYDGTGVTGDNFPATQSQVGQLSTGSAAISKSATTAVVTVGTETLTFAAALTRDGIHHEVDDVAGQIDFYYEFDVGGNGVAVTGTMFGRLQGNNDVLPVFAYNWIGASWDQLDTIIGSNSTTDSEFTVNLNVAHTGTGANIGKVRVRAYEPSTLTTATIFMDQIFVSYAVVAQSVGYDGGKVWVNTATGTAGTESYVNGVADNPVDTFAQALTIAGNLNIHQFDLSPDSTLTLAANLNDVNVYGIGYTLNFGGFDCGGTHFYHASPVNGTVLSAADHVDILDSIIANVTLDDSHFTNSTFTGTVTMGGVASTVRVIGGRTVSTGGATFDFGTAAGIAHNLVANDFHGNLTINNFGNSGTDTMILSGNGVLTISASCTSGTINIIGDWEVTDNGSCTVIFDDNTTNIAATLADTAAMQPKVDKIPLSDGAVTWNSTALASINAEADTALTDYDGPTNTEMEARTPTAAQLAYMTDNAATGVPVTFTTSGGSTTEAVLNQVDGSGASSVDDQYKGCIIKFTDGTLKDVVTDILSYNGTTKVATIAVIPTAPTASHGGVLT